MTACLLLHSLRNGEIPIFDAKHQIAEIIIQRKLIRGQIDELELEFIQVSQKISEQPTRVEKLVLLGAEQTKLADILVQLDFFCASPRIFLRSAGIPANIVNSMTLTEDLPIALANQVVIKLEALGQIEIEEKALVEPISLLVRYVLRTQGITRQNKEFLEKLIKLYQL